jgi:hypothetical protein
MITLSMLLLAAPVVARPKSTFIELRTLPKDVKGLATIVSKEKPSDFRKQAVWAMETKLREKGEELTDPDAVDAIVDETLKRVFDDMALPTDVYKWEGDDAPRGDVLIRDPVLILPGRTSSGFAKQYSVSPMGRRIDGGFRNTKCTVKITVAKSPAEWFTHVDTKGWGIALDPLKTSDGVVRIVLRFLSKAGTEPASARHERPVWVGFFRQEATGGPWVPVLFLPAAAKLQAEQETTLMPVDPKETITEAMKQHVLAIRLGDLAVINEVRSTLHQNEAKWTSLDGLSGSVVDRKNAAWLEPLRTSTEPLVRAAAILKLTSLGVATTADELIDIITTVKQARVQGEALLVLNKRLDASAEPLADEDKAALVKLASDGEFKRVANVVRLKAGTSLRYFKKVEKGWDPVVPKK